MNKLNTISLIILMLITFNASSNTIVVMGPSVHSHNNTSYNNDNAGIGYEVANVGVYMYHNSYYKASVAVSVNKEYTLTKDLSVGAALAYVTGYEDSPYSNDGRLLLPLLSIRYKSVRISTTTVFTSAINAVSNSNATGVINLQRVFNY